MSKFPENSEMRTSKEFCKRIKELIADNDCASNKEFADLVGVSFPIISKAVNFGIIPSTKILIKIADSLDLSLAYLLGFNNDNDFIGSVSPSDFYTRIQELVQESNKTFGGIASKLAFSRTYFYAWKKNNTLPSIEYAKIIADYFDVSLDYLFGRSDYRK
ncbi:MAG: transcriptional regulator [Clostridia bacterium]|nr:transcriptional regulator [Clostridia bacterium]MDE7216345.1 transcriptional regulator [Clostridia bacterium]